MAAPSASREQEILKYWQDNNIFEKSLAVDSPNGNFVFYEGPPTANAAPGVHHVLARAFKDIFPRYKTMRGYRVVRKAGWDTHGLPVELQVEKKLGLKSKSEIEDIVKGDAKASIVKFNDECKKMVWSFKEDWEKLTARIGFWIDLKHPYITYENSYLESVWAVIKKAADRGLLYQGHKVVPYCTRCGTALSSHEVAQGYRNIEEDSIYVKCKVIQGNQQVQAGDYILTWTTTPWTLPGNVALAVGKDFSYVRVKVGSEYFILAKDLVAQVIGETHQIESEFKGKDLTGVKYQPLFPDAVDPADSKTAWTIQAADFVTTNDGTGVVHTAVMYGEDDYQLGKQVGLPKQHTVDQNGKFLDHLGSLAGKYVKDDKTTELIYQHLKDAGAFYKIVPYEHDYPFCWRCDTPLIYYAKDSWFIAMTKLQKDLLKNADRITWVPSHIKAGRFGEWLEGIKDWAISRERYWGTPLPVWRCGQCDRQEVIGSLNQLYEKAIKRNTFFISRHGHAENNAAQVISADLAGSKKYPLTDEGKKQVERLVKQAKKDGITQIVTSPFTRTKQTAELVGQALAIPVAVMDDFRELSSPAYEGKLVTDIKIKYPTIQDYFGNQEGIEDPAQATTRMLAGLKKLDQGNNEQKILIISHGDPIWYVLSVVQGYNLDVSLGDDYPDFAQLSPLPIVPELITDQHQYNFHRPYVDGVKLQCQCGGTMERTPEVLDVWFDSGSMPFSQYHYPFENRQLIEKKGQQYPADYISEAIDQTRGWFYTLLAISTIVDQGTSYKNVICLGHINDAKGQKMSKSKGNIVDPWKVIDQHGADALRWYLYTVNQPGEPKNFDVAAVAEAGRKPLLLLDNVLSFYLLYAKDQTIAAPKPTHLLDQWILARLNQLIEQVSSELDHYHVIESARAIGDFVNELSTWYVRRSRERFKAGDQVAVQTLGYVLFQTSKLLAPFVPFSAEHVYQSLTAGPLRLGSEASQSVHLDRWPPVDKKSIDQDLLEQMELARNIVERGLAARAEAIIKVRQPLQSYTTSLTKDLPQEIIRIVIEELNVKELKFGADKLDTALTPQLEAEGLAREMIRQINQLRKEAKLTISDTVVVYQEGLDEVVKKFGQEIKHATLASAISAGKTAGMKDVGAGKVGIKKS